MPDRLILHPDAVARLMPLHLWLTPDGMIRQVGPTLQKLRPGIEMPGGEFDDLFDLRRPRDAGPIWRLGDGATMRVQLAFRGTSGTALKGLAIGLGKGRGVLINLSFGISVVDAVAQFGLTLGDFAATDLAVEMLYLVEAKTAVEAETRRLTQRLQLARIAAEEQAYTDTLTGLKNRRALQPVMARLLEQPAAFGVMHVDLDYFKEVNDTHGHAAGDHVLQQAAQILQQETRASDTVIRLGGDEFVLLLDGPMTMARMRAIAQRIIERLQEPIPFEGNLCRISASIGAALSSDYDHPEPEQLLHDADMALYASKRAGRARLSMANGQEQATAGWGTLG
ncbi:GGDEF domain-containing protein [Actibacterium sp. XHP0104]|uniref:GGDEF domain-containing protein n=1 Tax=Actibacterium sp. XHP0104 TaxID=2984335 RepID=UPI0021E7A790|nr:GGDEF domain-containing protein [Actibacterium sp. XHP0104]MCV2881401.1 GGDEF domain-containing protein [Actibacterium sp. XHP0104]